MKKLLTILFLFISYQMMGQVNLYNPKLLGSAGRNQITTKGLQVVDTLVLDSAVYFNNLRGHGVGVIGITNAGKAFWTTAIGSTPGIDDVLAVGQVLTTDRTIDGGGFNLDINNFNTLSIGSLSDISNLSFSSIASTSLSCDTGFITIYTGTTDTGIYIFTKHGIKIADVFAANQYYILPTLRGTVGNVLKQAANGVVTWGSSPATTTIDTLKSGYGLTFPNFNGSANVTALLDTTIALNKTGVQPLTNKIINASSNFITNIINANLSGSAAISNANLANSTISGISLGSTLAAHSAGYGLSGSNYTGAAVQTWKVDTSTSATNPATQGYVLRQGFGTGTVTSIGTSGGILGGTITTTGGLRLDKTAIDSVGALKLGSITTGFTPIDTSFTNAVSAVGAGIDITVGVAGKKPFVSADTTTGATKLATQGYVLRNAGTVTSVSGTTNRVTSTGGTTPVIDISGSYVGQTSLTTAGTLTTGTWNATAIDSAYLFSLTPGQFVAGLGLTFPRSGHTYFPKVDSTTVAGTTWTQNITNKLFGSGNTWKGNAIDSTYLFSDALCLAIAGSGMTISKSGHAYTFSSSGGTNYWTRSNGRTYPATVTDSIGVGVSPTHKFTVKAGSNISYIDSNAVDINNGLMKLYFTPSLWQILNTNFATAISTSAGTGHVQLNYTPGGDASDVATTGYVDTAIANNTPPTDFQKSYTTSPFTSSTTTLANVTGLTANLAKNTVYTFEAKLFITDDALNGSAFAIGGTTGFTTVNYEILYYQNTANTIIASSRETALGGSTGATGITDGYCTISGIIEVGSSNGTLTVQYAQMAASIGGASSLDKGYFIVQKLN